MDEPPRFEIVTDLDHFVAVDEYRDKLWLTAVVDEEEGATVSLSVEQAIAVGQELIRRATVIQYSNGR